MSNWFKKSQANQVKRYRAVVPIDIWINAVGNDPTDKQNAYNLLKQILNNGSKTVRHNGFNDLLEMGDIDLYSNFINKTFT